MGVKAILSIMLKSKGFGEPFLYSINHKNSLVSVDKLKSKNLDSLKHLLRVSTIEKLMGKSSEEKAAWNDYKATNKSVCQSIDKLKKYCSKMEEQVGDKLKERIDKYNLQKVKLKAQIEFLTKMNPANADYLNKDKIKEKETAINNATEKFNGIRNDQKYKNLLEESKCVNFKDYKSFKPAEKSKNDGGASDVPDFGEFLKMQKENMSKENKAIEDYINKFTEEKKNNDISNCEENIKAVVGDLVKLTGGFNAETVINMLEKNKWKTDSNSAVFVNLVSLLAGDIKDDSGKLIVSNTVEFRNSVSEKLKKGKNFSSKDFKNNGVINNDCLNRINSFITNWKKLQEEIAKLNDAKNGNSIKNNKDISNKRKSFEEFMNAYKGYIEKIEKCCKVDQNKKLRIYGQDERGAKNSGFKNNKALKSFLGKDTSMDKLLVEFNRNISKINAEILKYKVNYNAAVEYADEIKKTIAEYVSEYSEKFNNKNSGLKGRININGGELKFNNWEPPQDTLCLAQCVATVYYYIDKYEDNNFNIFGSDDNFIETYIEEGNKLKLGFTPAKK